MGKSGSFVGWITALLFLAPASAFALDRVIAGPVRVIDGDTLDIGGHRVRLHGIDAPEQAQTCAQPSGVEWACGAWVTAEVKARFAGRQATCQPIEIDRYGRIVATCQTAGVDIGEAIVAEGLAFAYRRYSSAYIAAEKGAAISGRGLHGQQVQNPAAYRKRKLPAQPRPEGCAIKGNISTSGKIFHVPGQRDYARTRISTGKGERWFCSAADARAAGWRAARR